MLFLLGKKNLIIEVCGFVGFHLWLITHEVGEQYVVKLYLMHFLQSVFQNLVTLSDAHK